VVEGELQAGGSERDLVLFLENEEETDETDEGNDEEEQEEGIEEEEIEEIEEEEDTDEDDNDDDDDDEAEAESKGDGWITSVHLPPTSAGELSECEAPVVK